MTGKRGTPIRSIIPFLHTIIVRFQLGKLVKWRSPLFLLARITIFSCFLLSILLFPTVTFAETIPYGIGSTNALAQRPVSDSSPVFQSPLLQLDETLEGEEERFHDETVLSSLVVASMAPETSESTLHRSYTVRAGDTLSSIATIHEISEDTIRQVNGIYKGYGAKTGQTLHIPPRNGIVYTLNDKQTIDDLVNMFHISRDRILYYNEYLEDSSRPLRGAEVFLPDIDPSSYVPSAPVRRYTKPRYSSSSQTPSSVQPKQETTAGFYRGYCTEWAANRTKELGKEAVTWRGNGGAWASNAAAQGRTVDKVPEVGAIVSTTEGRNTGHVAVIEQVNDDGSIVISEKNFSGWNRVSERVISPNDPQVLGIIH